MRFFLVILVSLLFSRAEAEVKFDFVNKVINVITDEFKQDMEDKGLNIQFNITAPAQIPNATAKWIKKNKLASINFTQNFLSLPELGNLAFSMIACHELGHFLGGEPYIRPMARVGHHRMVGVGTVNHFPNMSVEGQADYFASSVCFSRILPQLSLLALDVKDEWVDYCNDKTGGCLEALSAVNQTMEVFRAILRLIGENYGPVDILHKNVYSTPRTLDLPGEYPTLSCRAETLVNGFYASETNNQNDLRPKCWFKR